MKSIKKILVPTDFSDFSKRAAQFAIRLGQSLDCHITLYHLFQVQGATGSFVSLRKIIESDAHSDMEKMKEELFQDLGDKTTLEGVVIESDTVKAIVGKAKKENYDLIVMGTQGASGLGEVFLGSVAASVLRQTETPLLAIPQSATFQSFKNIVLALDDEGIKEYGNFDLLYTLLDHFKSKLNVVHVDTGSGDLELASQIDYFFKDIDYNYTCILDSENTSESVHRFTKTREADLLCMLHRKRSLLQRLFTASHTKAEVFHTQVPLLVLQE